MSQRGKAACWVGAILVVLITWYAFGLRGSAPTRKGPLKIGFIGPLTGAAANYGELSRNSIELAVKSIASQGKDIQVIYEDGGCNGKDAASAANKLVSIDRVNLIVGGMCSGEALAALPITDANKVILFASMASSPALSGAGKLFFRNSPSDAEGGRELASVVSKAHKDVAIVAEQTDYAQALRTVFEGAYKQQGGTIVSDQSFNTGMTDFRSLLLRVKNSGAQAILIDTQGDQTGGLIAKQARDLGIAAPFYGYIIPGGANFIKAAGSAANGTVFVDLASVDDSNTRVQTFLREYEKAYGAPDHEYYMAASYDAINILVQAVSAVGMDTTRIASYLHALPNYDGLIGTYHFDENGDPVGVGFSLYTIKNGKVQMVSASVPQ